MADLKNELVWSHSRARLLQACPRAYWYTYYGSWGGWNWDAPPETQDLWLQKKLTSVPLWTGTLVHGLAEGLLLRAGEGQALSEEEAVDLALERANRDIRDSELRRGRPGKQARFQEHYYQVEVDWDPVVDEIVRQTRGLFQNRIFRRLLQVPERIREVEKLQRFAVGDAEVYVSLDVLVDDGQGGAVIIDWKTGDAHDDAEIGAQLGVYGLYVHGVLGVPDDRIVAMHVNLRHQEETRHPVGETEIAAARESIATGMAAMRAKLRNPERNLANQEDFPPLDPGSARCQWCVFRRSCGRE